MTQFFIFFQIKETIKNVRVIGVVWNNYSEKFKFQTKSNKYNDNLEETFDSEWEKYGSVRYVEKWLISKRKNNVRKKTKLETFIVCWACFTVYIKLKVGFFFSEETRSYKCTQRNITTKVEKNKPTFIPFLYLIFIITSLKRNILYSFRF